METLMTRTRRCTAAVVLLLMGCALRPGPAVAWDATGHRLVTCLAMSHASLQAVPWLRTPAARQRLAYQSSEADRVRRWPAPALRHISAPNHYFEVDRLADYGLELNAVPPLRRDYLRHLVRSSDSRNTEAATGDPVYMLARPGFLAHALAEQYAHLLSSLSQARSVLEKGAATSPHDVQQARANVIASLGRLSHLVGDGSQPLHTTRHFNGWQDAKRPGFTRHRDFHGRVDSLPRRDPRLNCSALSGALPLIALADPLNPWSEILEYLGTSSAQVEALYALEAAAVLESRQGSDFVASRLQAAGGMLSSLLNAALKITHSQLGKSPTNPLEP